MLKIEPDYLIYTGVIGILLGLLFLIFFLYRRIRWFIRIMSKQKVTSPKLLAGLRNLIIIFLWVAIFGMVLFMGFFFRAYYVFTFEKPVAEIITQSTGEPDTNLVTLVQFLPDKSQTTHRLLIKGDQWMLEGDILKWKNWLNFLGLHTRYRLTRLRGRYIQAEDEKLKEQTIYPLVKDEDHPFWRFLYKYGHRLPLVSTAYGNSAFQTASEDNHFLIYVSTSGFVVRKKTEKKEEVY